MSTGLPLSSRLATTALRLLLLSSIPGMLHGQVTAEPEVAPPTAEGSSAAAAEERNIGLSSSGAAGVEVSGSTSGLTGLLAEQPDARAQMTPDASGSAVIVINLAGEVNLSRIQLDIAPARGRLVIVGMGENGEQVDLSTPDGVKNLVADRQLDGSDTALALDASQLTVKALMIVWIPEEPGTPLTLTKFGAFTTQSFEALAANPSAPIRPPAPIIPPAEIVQAIVAEVARTSTPSPTVAPPPDQTATVTTETFDSTASGAEVSTADTTTTSLAAPMPEPIPPQSKSTSI